jgi:hypothetical protein
MKRTTTRRIVMIAAGPATLAGLLLTTGTAFASTGPAGNGQAGHVTGGRAASYTDPVFGPVRCNETQHPAFDTVACQSATGAPLTGVVGGQAGSVGWNSDFGAVTIHPVTGTLTYTVSPDGLSYTGQATYPALAG